MIAVKNFWNHYDFFFKYKENAIVTYTIVIYFSNTKEKRKQLSKKNKKTTTTFAAGKNLNSLCIGVFDVFKGESWTCRSGHSLTKHGRKEEEQKHPEIGICSSLRFDQLEGIFWAQEQLLVFCVQGSKNHLSVYISYLEFVAQLPMKQPGSIPCTVILTIVLTSPVTIFHHMFHISILFDNTSMLGGKIHLYRGWMGLGYWRWVEMGTHLSSTSSRRLTLAPQFCCVGLRSLPGRASLARESLLRRAPKNL